MVTRSITRVEEDKISIKIDDVGQQYPSQSNTVRMTNIHGEWKVIKLANNFIEISYQGTGNASGNIPIWLANKVLIDSTYATFVNLSEILKDEKYHTF
jgi:hypothetical protein